MNYLLHYRNHNTEAQKSGLLLFIALLLFTSISVPALAQAQQSEAIEAEETIERVRQLMQRQASLTHAERQFLNAHRELLIPQPGTIMQLPPAELLMESDPVFEESFNENALPDGWSVENFADPEDNSQVWEFDNPGERDFTGGFFEGFFPIIDSNFYGTGNVQNTALVTPALDLSQEEGFLVIGYDEFYNDRFNSQAFVEISTDGENWELVIEHTGNVGNVGSFFNPLFVETQVMYDISEYAGEPEVYIRWRFDGSNSNQWAFDNFKVYEPAAVPILALSPNSLDYGSTFPGGSYTRSFEIENVGYADLEVNLLPDAPNVSIDPSSAVIERLEVQSFDVIYTAEQEGEFEGIVAIENNTESEESVEVSLSATVNPLVETNSVFADFNNEEFPEGFENSRFVIQDDGGIDDTPHVGNSLSGFFSFGSLTTNFVNVEAGYEASFFMRFAYSNALGPNVDPVDPEDFDAALLITNDFGASYDTLANLNNQYDFNPDADADFQEFTADLSAYEGDLVQLVIEVQRNGGSVVVSIDDVTVGTDLTAGAPQEDLTLDFGGESVELPLSELFSGGFGSLNYTLENSDEAVVEPLLSESSLTLNPLEPGTSSITLTAVDTLDTPVSQSFDVTVAAEAQAQIIHNAADPLLESVDIYVNGDLTLESVGFREATGFLTLPAGVALDIVVTPEGAEPEVGVSFERTLTPDGTFVLVANGVLNPDDFTGAEEITVDLFAAPARTESEVDGEVDLLVFHGSTDAPAVDLGLVGIGKFLEDISYGSFSEYVSVPEEDYVLQLFVAGAETPLLSYELPLGTLEAGGQSFTALASGFLNPAENQDGAGFAIIAVDAEGNVIPLPLETRTITFSVDMALESFEGNFNPQANDKLYVRGTFNDQEFVVVAENELEPAGGSIWEVSLDIAGVSGSEVEYKYFVEAGDDRDLPNDGLEGDVGPGENGNRVLELPAEDTELETVVFNNEEIEMAMAQIIHNAADPAAEMVDVYINGDLTLEDFAFRTATPFLPLPALTDIEVAVAAAGSESVDDALATFDFNLAPGENYTIVAQGVLNPENFAENPDGESIALTLAAADGARTVASNEDVVDLNAIHGSTDAPAVDVFVRELEDNAYSNIMYGDISDYLSVIPMEYAIEVRPAGVETAIFSYIADLTVFEGQSLTLLASGFVNPAANQDGEGFALIGVDADGNVVTLPEENRNITFSVNMALEQFEGNFDPQADDKLYIRGGFNDQEFAILEENELSLSGDGIWEVSLDLAGISGNEVEYKYYVEAGDGRSLPNDGWEGDVGSGENGNRVLELPAEDTGLETVVFNNEEIEMAMAQVIHNAADPATEQVDVYVNGELTLEDFAFRSATPFLPLPALADLEIAVAAAGSESVDDALASFDFNLEPGVSYTIVAQGVLNPEDFAQNPNGENTGFTLAVAEDARQAAEDETSVEFSVVHGSTDAPAVDVFVQEVDANLFDNLVYGDISEYVAVPADAYTVELRPAGSEEAVLAFIADVSTLEGQAFTLLASGFLNPADNQNGAGFALVAALPNGDVLLLDEIPTSTDAPETPVEFALEQNYPNPFNPTTNIEYSLPEAGEVRLEVYNLTGQRVATLVDGQQNAGQHTISFDAARLSSGVYLYRIQAGSFSQTRKMMLIK